MPTFDASTAECLIFSYKEGLLSAMGHDLKLRAGRFMITVSEPGLSIDAYIDAASVQVVCALRDGRDDPGELSEADRQKIGRNATEDVLHASRYPEVRFQSKGVTPEGDGYLVRGELTLCGVTRPLELRSRAEGGRQVAEVTLHQPDFGIKPYSGLLGALKIKPDVRVRVSLPWPAA